MKCIIIDDEPIARKGMKRLVESNPALELLAVLDGPASALDWLENNQADLAFLDIEMPGMSGIDLARQLPKEMMIIFTTAYSEYALESYEVDAIDYLVKPINKERFNRAVERAATYLELISAQAEPEVEDEPDYLIVKADRRYVRVKLSDVLYIEGLKDYVIFHLVTGRVVTRMTMKGVEELLPQTRFLRVSKSYIANKDKIDSFDSNDVFIGTTELGMGQLYKERVLSALLKGR